MEAPTQALTTLHNKVKVPAMLEKLARDWNITPRSQADVDYLIDLGAHLRVANQNSLQKQAGDEGNPFLKSALGSLKEAMAAEGYDVGPNQQEQLLKEAAFQKTQEADVAYAALEYANYLARLQAQPAA